MVHMARHQFSQWEEESSDTGLSAKDFATLKSQVLLKEIDVRSAEINTRLTLQMQSVNSLVILLAGLTALATFLIISLKLPVIPWVPFICVLYSFISLTFVWMNLDHDVQMADIG